MNQLVIDLDSLTPLRAQRISQMVLAYAGDAVETPLPVLKGWHISKDEVQQLERVHLTADQVAAVDETAGIPDSGHIAPGYGPVTAKQYEEFVTTGGIVGLAVKFPEQLLPPAPTDSQPVGRIDPERASPPVPAPSTAAAAPLPTAPVEQQAGAAATPSASTPPAPSVPMPPAPPAPAGTGSPVPAVEVMHRPDGTVESVPPLDSRGLPWDDRIHSVSKALNADKTWRARRNMSDEQKAAVPGIEAELRASLGQGHLATAAQSSAPAASAVPLPPPAPPVPAPTATAPDGTTAALGSPAPANAVELVQRVTPLLGGMLGEDELQRACASVGLPDSPQALMHLFAAEISDPTVVPRLVAELERIMAD